MINNNNKKITAAGGEEGGESYIYNNIDVCVARSSTTIRSIIRLNE